MINLRLFCSKYYTQIAITNSYRHTHKQAKKSFIRLPNDLYLQNDVINFKTKTGKSISLKAVWQDNLPSGSSLGTVVTLPGSPGSHNDFKYIEHELRGKGIRVIGLNFPGFNYTEGSSLLTPTNEDRDLFVSAMVDHLNIDRIIWMGHSRGSENALRGAVRHSDRSIGLVQCNSIGLRRHRGVKPYAGLWVGMFGTWLYELSPLTQPIATYLTGLVYKYLLPFRLSGSEEAMLCLRTMRYTSIKDQRPFVEEFNRYKHLKACFLYAGKDFLMEKEISSELVREFENNTELVLPTNDEDSAIEFVNSKMREGYRTIGVCILPAGHFQQRDNAKVAAAMVMAVANNTKV